MSVELTITVRDEENRKLTREYLIYEQVTLDPQDPIIEKYLQETLAEFKGIPDDVKLKAVMVLQ